MHVVFRADASIEIGSGHVMRCLTLATALRERGTDITFICREHPGNLISLLESEKYHVVSLPLFSEYEVDELTHASWLGASQLEDATQTLAILQ